jgi:hypothetical protein
VSVFGARLWSGVLIPSFAKNAAPISNRIMTRLLLMVMVAVSAVAQGEDTGGGEQARVLHCDYKYMYMPAAQLELGFWSNNEPQTSLALAFGIGGVSQKQTFTPGPLAENEMAHGIISKEAPSGAIELIIYSQPQPQGDSRLINHNFSQEFWGTCHYK